MSESNIKPGPSGTVKNGKDSGPLVHVAAVGHPVKSKKDEDFQDTKARGFKALLTHGKGLSSDLCSSKLTQYQIKVIFGQQIETFPKTVFKTGQPAVAANSEPDPETNFEALLHLNTHECLDKMLQWSGIGQTADDVFGVLNRDEAWNRDIFPAVNELCEHVLEKLEHLTSVGIKEGLTFFRHLGKHSCHDGLTFFTQILLGDIRKYARQMTEGLLKASLRTDQPTQKKESSTKKNEKEKAAKRKYQLPDGGLADNEDDDYTKRPKLDVPQNAVLPNSETHCVLTGLWNNLLRGIILPDNHRMVYLFNGHAKSHLKFDVRASSYSLICKPDGLAQYDTEGEGADEDNDQCVPYLVLECKTALGSGWWKRGTSDPDYKVPVTALSEWVGGETPSSAVSGSEDLKSPPKVTPTKGQEKHAPPYPSPPSRSVPSASKVSGCQYQEPSVILSPPEKEVSPFKKPNCKENAPSRRERQSPEQKLARHLMSARLEKFRTQHTVELCTALKQNQSKNTFRTKVYGFYVSDHLVFPTRLEAHYDDIDTDPYFHKVAVRRMLNCNVVEGNSSDDDTVESYSKHLKYQCVRSPIPLNLFCPSHFRAIACYTRYLVTEHIKNIIDISALQNK